MRLFIGSRLSPAAFELAAELRDLARPYFGGSVKWVEPYDLHVTCAFLGEVSQEAGLQDIMKCMDASAGSFRAIGAALGGLGAFPSFECPRVIWLGFTEGADELKALAINLARGLNQAGFAPGREFFPHVTLGRVKEPFDSGALAEAVSRTSGRVIRYTVESLELIESRLSSAGADYRTLYSSRLL